MGREGGHRRVEGVGSSKEAGGEAGVQELQLLLEGIEAFVLLPPCGLRQGLILLGLAKQGGSWDCSAGMGGGRERIAWGF